MRFVLAVGAVVAYFVLTFVASVIVVTSAFSLTLEEINYKIDSTNFLVGDGCSGTLIATPGLGAPDAGGFYVLTAEHCVSSQFRTIERETVDDRGVVKKEKVRITLPGTVSQIHYKGWRSGGEEIARVVHTYTVARADKELDLALLKLKGIVSMSLVPAKVACKAPRRGETAYIVGNPFGVLYASVTKGVVSHTGRMYHELGIDDQGDNVVMQVSSGMVGGNSGGAVYNENWELIGVPVRGSRINEILGFAVPLDDIKKFLRREFGEKLWSHCQ